MAPAEASAASRASEAAFAVRLVSLEHVSAKPRLHIDPTHSPLTERALRTVPIVRVFGPTPRGQKVCLHMHGSFRYFYVPWYGVPPRDPKALRNRLKALADELDQALDGVQPEQRHRQQHAAGGGGGGGGGAAWPAAMR